MSISVRINEELYHDAKLRAKAEVRTTSGQIEYWARIGKVASENPDLPIDMIESLLVAKHEPTEEFEFHS